VFLFVQIMMFIFGILVIASPTIPAEIWTEPAIIVFDHSSQKPRRTQVLKIVHIFPGGKCIKATSEMYIDRVALDI